MQIDLEFVAEQFQTYADLDPTHWNEAAGSIPMCGVLIYYQRFEDHFVLEIAGEEYEIPRI